ncbi:hypothetical protein KDA11_06375, partial [Candidatus Saccharibacteria bacterium]|nr:hypothetical protein [Candidatus Saccharibacteria bacterium]
MTLYRFHGDVDSNYFSKGTFIEAASASDLDQTTSFSDIYYNNYVVTPGANINFIMAPIESPIHTGYVTSIINNNATYTITVKDSSSNDVITAYPGDEIRLLAAAATDTWVASRVGNIYAVSPYTGVS